MEALKTIYDTYLCSARNTSLLEANRIEVKKWERFKVIPDPSNPTHGWVEDSSGNNVYEDYEVARIGKTDDQAKKYMGLWQRDNLLSIQCANTGKWLQVTSDLIPIFNANKPQEFIREDIIIPYRQIEGGLKYSVPRRTFYDNNGAILPCFTHFGDGRALFSVNESRVREVFNSIRDAQFTGVLSWSILNDINEFDAWHIPPYFWLGPKHQSDFWQKTEDYGNLCKEYGLVWLASLGGLNSFNDWTDLKDFIHRFCDIISRVGWQYFSWETCNELHASSNQRWWDSNRIDEVTDIVRNSFPDMIVLTTSVGGTEDANEIYPYNRKTNIVCNHTFRKLYIGNKADHPWTFGYETIEKIRNLSGNSNLYRGWATEPCGPFSDIDAFYGGDKVKAYVSVQDNGHRHHDQFDDESVTLIAAKCFAGGNAYNFFCSAGVKFFDGARFEDYPGFKNVGKLIQILPQDIWEWGHITGHGDDNRNWSSLRFISAAPGGRADSLFAHDGNKAFTVCNGEGNIQNRHWAYPVLRNCKVTSYDLKTLEIHTFEKRASESLEFHCRWGRAFYFEAL